MEDSIFLPLNTTHTIYCRGPTTLSLHISMDFKKSLFHLVSYLRLCFLPVMLPNCSYIEVHELLRTKLSFWISCYLFRKRSFTLECKKNNMMLWKSTGSILVLYHINFWSGKTFILNSYSRACVVVFSASPYSIQKEGHIKYFWSLMS